MARPIFLVHDQETIDNYRRLERILRELYQVLGELLAYGAPLTPATVTFGRRHPPPPPPPPSQPENPGALQNTITLLSTLLGQAFPSGSSSQTNHRDDHNSRRQNRNRSELIDETPKTSLACTNWSALGGELRMVAESLNTSRNHGQVPATDERKIFKTKHG